MKTLRSIAFPWIGFMLFYGFAYSQALPQFRSLPDGLIVSASALLAIISFRVSQRGPRGGGRPVFLNFCVFFGFNAIQSPMWMLISSSVVKEDAYRVVYFTQYYLGTYFFLLLFCTCYLFVQSECSWLSTSKKYFLTLFVVLGLWLWTMFPYVLNPRYLYSTRDVKDFKAIKIGVSKLRLTGSSEVSARDLLPLVSLYSSMQGNIMLELVGTAKEERLAELLRYTKGYDYVLLIYKPLNRDCLLLSLFSIGALALFLIRHYSTDPPEPAYVEKIVFLLFLFCLFEAFHSYVLSITRSYETYQTFNEVGQYFSVVTMLALVFVLLSRLRFIGSVEGNYYEQRLLTDATHITRWRDAFDNWVLRQFMNPKELDQRFLIQPKDERTEDVP